MKVRTCFVSNSSSSSCVCDLCGRTETGWDLYAGPDSDMFECINGHLICTEEAVMNFDEWQNSLGLEENDDSGVNPWNEVPEKMCPICSMLQFCQEDLGAYLLKKTGIPKAEVFAVVKAANKRRKKLYDTEYVMYALTKTGIRMEDLIAEIKTKFPTYKEFMKGCK